MRAVERTSPLEGVALQDDASPRASSSSPDSSASRRLPHAGRRAEFEELALPLLDRLFAMALHLVRDPNKADDLVQEAYLRAWQNFDRFTPGTHFKAWIFQILTYLFMNERRSGQRRESLVDFSQNDSVPAPAAPDAGQAARPDVDWNALYPQLVDDRLKGALDRLPPEQRMVVLLTSLGDFSYQDCADILEVPIGTIMSRLFRARKQLQEDLADYAQERGLTRGVKNP